MWRALLIGWLALALAEDISEETGVTKRQTARGNTVVYGAAPGQYTIQTPERHSSQAQSQAADDYQQQLYVISPSRKASAQALTYSSESPRRPQYIQVSALQYQAAQQAAAAAQQAAHQQLPAQSTIQRQHQHQHQHQHAHAQAQAPQQLAYESLIGQTEAGHGFYRPSSARVQPESRPQPEERLQPQLTPVQYAASGIVDSQVGSFERELAQLVAANRAQEQKYNAKKHPAPQQYLKEITRPTPKPYHAARIAHQPAPVQYQAVAPQSPPLYRYLYQPQPEQIQTIPQAAGSQQQYKQAQEPQYARPQLQQYLHAQAQSQAQQLQAVRLRSEEDEPASAPVLRPRVVPASTHSLSVQQPEAPAPSRSTIYVSQSTPLKKPSYPTLSSLSNPVEAQDDEETAKQAPVPVVRIPPKINKPLTQDEFQKILQSGGYTATFVPSDDPNSPHQEYLLHPTGAQRPLYASEKQQEAVTYLLPQTQPTRQLKRRPVYNIQQA